jgi:hypothetical protein
MAVNIRKLSCGICFCLVNAPLQCSNIKCGTIFCSECIKNTLVNESMCPFCRLDVEFLPVDHTINYILNGLKVFCNHLRCSSLYRVDQFIRHNKEKEHIEDRDKCATCGLAKELIWCNECNFMSCLECNFLLHCEKCEINICLKCNRNNYQKHIICKLVNCSECGKEKGDIITYCCNRNFCKNDVKFCEKCNGYYCQSFPNCNNITAEVTDDRNLSTSNSEAICPEHENKLNYISCCFKSRSGLYKCKKCEAKTCASSFCHQKCSTCLEVFCKDCFILCKICKRYTCKDCAMKCQSCEFSNSNSYSCKSCSLPSLKKCAVNSCSKLLCINCWKVCNACSVIQCEEHSIKCSGCEESVCPSHIYNCKGCNTNYSKGKLCLKNCTYKCENCPNISTSYCDRQSHTIVYNLKCRHNICEQCIRKCSKCYDPKQLNHHCPICIFSFYEKKILFCKFCKQDYCSNCFKYCRRCEEYYCLFNKCGNCDEIIKKCTNCIMYKSRINCNSCKFEIFNLCKSCDNILLCSLYCYIEYGKKVEHLCQMFNCRKCIQIKEENNLLPQKNCESLFDDSDWLDMESSFSRYEDSEYSVGNAFTRRYREDKVRVGCNESCTCNIF